MKEKILAILLLTISGLLGLITLYRHGPSVYLEKTNLSAFCGDTAYDHIRDLVALGPRTIGSESVRRARDQISAHLQGLGLEVIRDRFRVEHFGQEYAMENIIAVVPGRTTDIIALGGHYDTKDIPGANDGGSSAGLLMEMARILPRGFLNHTVWLVFFDGEDSGDSVETMFYGSRHLAARVKAERRNISWMIVVDMIGDRNLKILRDANSDPLLADYIWSRARALGYRRYFAESTKRVIDDHLPFVEIGVPSCVLIDFNYGPWNSYWHTAKDDMDKIDPRSLKIVGDVVYHVIIGLDRGDVHRNG